MEISRDLFLTDDRTPYLTLALSSRDVVAHNLLTSLTAAERERLGHALADASTAVMEVLRPAHARHASARPNTIFGCGT
jgi:hypothetical protein